MNVFIGLEDQKHFINEYQEHCDVIEKLIHWGKMGVGNIKYIHTYIALSAHTGVLRYCIIPT